MDEQTRITDAKSPPAPSTSDLKYTFNHDALQKFRDSKPWMEDPKYFEKVAVSPTAIMKMMMHCHSGVEKGMKKGANPIEVMGLILGRPDPNNPKTLILTDVFPLPIEGFETRVIADDQDVINHMISLGESLEKCRHEKFMGWYHSHPFDVGLHPQCFLSTTDLTTQLQWQRSEDPHGNPFVAVVVDPLRSLVKNSPVLQAFRVYPPGYSSPVPNECPDGTIVSDEKSRLERWGACWNRYYVLEMEFFMSNLARRVMGTLTQNFLWMRVVGSTPMMESENRVRFPDRVFGGVDKVRKVAMELGSGVGGGTVGTVKGLLGGGGGEEGRSSLRGRGGTTQAQQQGGSSLSAEAGATVSAEGTGSNEDGELDKAVQGIVDLATEKMHGNLVQLAKKNLFC